MDIEMPSNKTLDAESAQVGLSKFVNFLIICSSVTVRYAQFRSARR